MATDHCRRCGSRLVYATDGRQIAADSWEVVLRCPECESLDVAHCKQAEVDEMDRDFDLSVEQIARTLAQLQAHNMGEWVDCFVRAVESDLIGADDFVAAARPSRRG